jgi:hypothetical protein
MADTQSLQAGVQQAWFMFYDANGEPSGNDVTPLTNGQDLPAYHLRGIQELPTGIPETEAVTITGDDTSLGSILFSSDAPREFVANFGQMDLALEQRLQNTNLQTVAGAKIGAIDSPDAVLATGALIVQSRAIIDGLAAWSGFIYPLVQLQPLNRETFSGRTAGVIRYKGVAQLAFHDAWGTTIVNRQGADSSLYAQPFTSSNPMTLHAFRGAITSFTALKTPALLAKTAAFVDKVQVTVASVNTPTARLITLSAPVAAGRPGMAPYQYNS